MDYKKECPYCHKNVKMKVIPYAPDHDIYGYIFWCDCVEEDEDHFQLEERAAYQLYLETRELNNLTNYDKYFGHDGRTLVEFDNYIDE